MNEETIGPLSFHPRSFTEGFLKSKEIEWNYRENSTSQLSTAGESVEKIALRNEATITPKTKKSSTDSEKNAKKDDSSLTEGGSGVTLLRA